MKKTSLVTLAACFLLSGCSQILMEKPAAPQPTEELFVAIPKGLPTNYGPAIYEEVHHYISTSPVGTPLTFFLADNQELLSTVTIPAGSKSYRRKVVKKSLAKVFERLDPEKTGGSQAVDLLAIPSSIRKYRKRNDLKPRVILIGDPLIEDREQGNSITKERLPCDGCVTNAESSYGKMPVFPEGTTVSWLTLRANYGNGPNHRQQVEHFLRYLLQEKQGPLIRFSSEAKVVFGSREKQWDSEVSPLDNCTSAKQVAYDEPKAVLYDKDGKTRVLIFSPELTAKIRQPEETYLRGDKRRVLFIIDVSGSVVEDSEGNDQSHVFRAIVADATKKIETMQLEQFAVCAFGGWADLSPRLPRHPLSILSSFYWADATPKNRDRGVRFVQGLEAGGGTPTSAALRQALQLEGPMICLLYSDGVPTIGSGGQPEVLELAKQLKKQGATINTIGVGALSAENDEFDWTGGEFLAEIAMTTGGDYFVLGEGKRPSELSF